MKLKVGHYYVLGYLYTHIEVSIYLYLLPYPITPFLCLKVPISDIRRKQVVLKGRGIPYLVFK